MPYPLSLLPGLGGLTYWLTIYPVDCIKSAMQTDSIIRSERKYTTFLGTARVGVGRTLGWGVGDEYKSPIESLHLISFPKTARVGGGSVGGVPGVCWVGNV